MSGTNDRVDQMLDYIGPLIKERDALRALLAEAAEEIEHWGSYAGDYFAEKWDLAGASEKFRQASKGVMI